MEIQVPIQKIDAKRQMAFGWANVFLKTDGDAITDSHAETIDTDEAIEMIEDAVYRYVLHSRSGDEQHVNFGVARLVESMVFTDEKRAAIAAHAAVLEAGPDAPVEAVEALAVEKLQQLQKTLVTGWWVGFKIDDPDAWKKVEDGSLPMFSIVGRAQREEIT